MGDLFDGDDPDGKDKRRNDPLNNDDESTSEDDEDAKDIEHYEKEFFLTLAWLKTEDPSKYDRYGKICPGPSTIPKNSRNEEGKPFDLQNYERNIIVENKSEVNDDEEIPVKDPRSSTPSEQKTLDDSCKQAIEEAGAEEKNDNINNNFEEKETNTKVQKEDYKEWLKDGKNELKDVNTASELMNLHVYWTNPKLNSEEVFLRDYILNHKFLDPDDKDYQPAYNEVVHDSCDLVEDMRYLDLMDEFEEKYNNFNFEDPDKGFTKRYPRCIETAIRRKEIWAKIEKIKQITGNESQALNFEDYDFEDDFNPEKHDQKMRELFNDDYYQVEEEEDKPKCPELERYLEIENWENWQKKDAQDEPYNVDNGENPEIQPESEAPVISMDCDIDTKAQFQHGINLSKSKKKQKSKSKLAAVLAKAKPVFDPNDKKFEDYFDEHYKLDCEDVIDDLPCRFKYRQTTPNDYGLTVDEILKADVKELNKWCSLKRLLEYKPEHVERHEVQVYKKKAKNEALKRKILPSLYISHPDNNMHQNGIKNSEMRGGKKKKKRKENIEILNAAPGRTGFEDAVAVSTGTQENKTKKRKLQEKEVDNEQPEKEHSFSDNSMISDSPEKFVKQKKKKHKKENSINKAENDTSENFQNSVVQESKLEDKTKGKKKKIKEKKQNKKRKLLENEDDNAQHEKEHSFTDNTMISGSPEKFVKQKKKKHKKSINEAKNDTSENCQNSTVQEFKMEDKAKANKNKIEESNSNITISDDHLKIDGIHPENLKNEKVIANSKCVIETSSKEITPEGSLPRESSIINSGTIGPTNSGEPEPACNKRGLETSGNPASKLKTKNLYFFGTLNINTLIRPGKLKKLITVLDEYQIKLLALQETRYMDENPMESEGYRIFKGRNGWDPMGYGIPHLGTGFIVNIKIVNSVIDFYSPSERLSVMTLRCANKSYTLINGHAPMNEDNKKKREEVEIFWGTLHYEMLRIPERNVKILLGDFNALIGRERKFKNTVGKYPAHSRTNRNGERLIELCRVFDLKLMSTSFKKLPRKQVTWKSPYSNRTFQFDHVAISFRSRNEINDVKVKKTANIETDHYLTIIKMNFIPQKVNEAQKSEIQSINAEILESKKQEFREKLNVKLGDLKGIQTIFAKPYRIVPLKKKRNPSWWNEQCAEAYELRKQTSIKWLSTKKNEDYVNFRKQRSETAKIIRSAKRKFEKDQLLQLGEDKMNNTEVIST